MKKLVSLILALVLTVACLSGVVFADDYVMQVINGTEVTNLTSEDFQSKGETLISPEGTTVVKLLKDHTTSEFGFWSPYSYTMDMNGFTIKCGRNGLFVEKAGSVNSVTKIFNGTINCMGALAIRIDGGSVEVSDVVAVSQTSACFGLYSDTAATSTIKNCTLVSKAFYAVSFNSDKLDQSAHTIEISDSTLVTIVEAGQTVLGTRAPAAGTFKLGKNVDMYTYKPDGYVGSKPTMAGEAVTMAEGTHNVFVEEFKSTYYDLVKYSTPAGESAPATDVPATDVPATDVPATGVSVAALGIMAVVSLAGAMVVRKKED